ncbi:MAG: site-specific DNA-methyltransferase [Acidobacteriia bacterium]|nr:site-specific DNA-methyltransferase [Terriglobia bacterium]
MGLTKTPPDGDSVRNPEKKEEAVEQERQLSFIGKLDSRLTDQFGGKLLVHKSLTRQLVSFQANKQRPAVRWYKYKEAFSAALIDFLLSRYDVRKGSILDPFAGAGTALFVAADAGLDADGIELLPIGQEIIKTRQLIRALSPTNFQRIRQWVDASVWKKHRGLRKFLELRITAGAYPPRTIALIEKYLYALDSEPPKVRSVLRFALLCVLENISYTRKDGQYLRWDYRSGRRQGAKRFDKGKILDFESAISAKITEIVNDISSGSFSIDLFVKVRTQGNVNLMPGSCLQVLPKLRSNRYSAVVTSPPYCNRYDYTRTYALELALLGVNEAGVSSLRQQMLSCTVENRAKDLLSINSKWKKPIEEVDRQELLQAILAYLDWCRDANMLNNNGIARMVRGYFYEMACVIAECGRVLKPGAPLIMVNDNVRYAGASISVDLILSALAERLGFTVDNILVLPSGKGNSSQQMGEHGRDALRKCVYVWRKNPCLTVGI